jgi:hypothetical protein
MTKHMSPKQSQSQPQIPKPSAQLIDEHLNDPHPGLDEKGLKVHVLLHALVERQLEKKEPPEIVHAYMRLQARGESRHEAIHAIAQVMAEEALHMLREKRPLDHSLYREKLGQLGVKRQNRPKNSAKSGR